MTVAQQLGVLRNSRGGPDIRAAQVFTAVLALGLLVAAIITQHPWAIMLFVFFGIVAITGGHTIKHTNNAIDAYESGVKAKCSVVIEQSDSFNYYYAKVNIADQKYSWEFDFIPDGWKPSEGEYSAESFHLENTEWPALVVVETGILVPRSKPSMIKKKT